MKTKTYFLLFLSMLVIVSCAPKTTVNKDQALVDSLLTVNINAYNSGNAQKITDLFTDDALMIVNGKNTWGKDSIYVVAKSIAPAIKNFKAYLGPTTVKDDLIQMQKYFTADIVMGDATLKGQGLAFLIWKKQADKSWKVVLEVENYDIKTY